MTLIKYKKISENIQKKECGPDRSVLDNQSSSVTLNKLAMEARKSYCTKLKVYKAVVLLNLLYAFETWALYKRNTNRLNHFHLSHQRKLFKMDPRERSHEEVRAAKHIYSFEAFYRELQKENALKVIIRNATYTLTASMKDFNN